MEYYSAPELFARIKETRSCREALERREDNLIYLWKKVEDTQHLVSEKGKVWEVNLKDSFQDDIIKTMSVNKQKRREIDELIIKARKLHEKGFTLREIGREVDRSYEWVRLYVTSKLPAKIDTKSSLVA